jgi:hypothetical protein
VYRITEGNMDTLVIWTPCRPYIIEVPIFPFFKSAMLASLRACRPCVSRCRFQYIFCLVSLLRDVFGNGYDSYSGAKLLFVDQCC